MPASHLTLGSAAPVLAQFMENQWVQETVDALQDFLPALLGALAILIIGYIIAIIAAAVTRRALHKTDMDDKLMSSLGRRPDTDPEAGASERAVGTAVFWAIMFFAFIAAFQVLGLTSVAQPLNLFMSSVFAYIPRIIGAAVLGLIAWGVATVIKRGAIAGLNASRFDERVGENAGQDRVSLSNSLATGLYWLVILLFVPAILGALQLQALITPVNTMLDEFMAFVPNLIGAAAILLVGWFIARIVRTAVTSVLSATGLDRAGERWGMQEAMGEQTLSGVVGLFVYVLILIPVIIGSLDALGIDAVTAPAQNALDDVIGAIPALAAAAGIVLIAYLVARVVADVVTGLAAGVGADRLWGKVGLREPTAGPRVSRTIGVTVGVAIVVLASIEAAAVLGFDLVANLATDLVAFAGRLAFGLVILVAGMWLARIAGSAVRATRMRNAGAMATLARTSVLVFAAGIALVEVGVASELVLLTFGITLGAAAIAGAIAFGIGGREVAEEQLRDWRSSAQGSGSQGSSGQAPSAVAGGED